MKKIGFTLVELLIVIIIIGILATMAVPQYNKMVDKAKWAEAVSIMGQIRKACEMYYMQKNAYPHNDNNIYLNSPSAELYPTNSSKGWLDIELPVRRADGRYVYVIFKGPTWYSNKPIIVATLDNKPLDGIADSTQEPTLVMYQQDGKIDNLCGAPKF